MKFEDYMAQHHPGEFERLGERLRDAQKAICDHPTYMLHCEVREQEYSHFKEFVMATEAQYPSF